MDKDFNNIIKNGLVLVDFSASWCGPCQMLAPILDNISKKRNDLKIITIDVDTNEDIALKYGIMSVPTLILFENGNLKKQISGFLDENKLLDWINN